MATHFLSSSNPIDLYVTETVRYTNIPNNTTVTVIDDGVGSDCSYHLVRIEDASVIRHYGSVYKVDSSVVFPLNNTKEFAPKVCIPNSEYDNNYIPPDDWYNTVNIPFLNKKDQKYYITVISNYKTFDQLELLKQESIRDGISKILEYYYKQNTAQVINTVLNYYKFAEFIQYYVPFEPNIRIKCQIAIPRKYVEAMQMKELDTSTSFSTGGYYLKDVAVKIDKLSSLLDQYQSDILFYNVKIKNINLSNDAKWLKRFREILESYFKQNDIKTLNKRGFVEFTIDNCYRMQNASYCDTRRCEYVKIGLSQLKKTAPFNNPTIMYMITNLDMLSEIRYCDTPWYEFLNRFYYPRQNVTPMENPLNKFNDYINGNLQSYFISNPDVLTQKDLEVKLKINMNLAYSGFQDKKKMDAEDRMMEAQKALIHNFRKNIVIFAGNKVLTKDGIKQYLANFSMDNVVEKLKEIKLCELSSASFECLGQLLPVVEISSNTNLDLSFTYKEQKNEVIPFLTSDEKRILFTQILKDKALDRQQIVRLIEKFEQTPDKLKVARKQTYEQLVETLINYMVS